MGLMVVLAPHVATEPWAWAVQGELAHVAVRLEPVAVGGVVAHRFVIARAYVLRVPQYGVARTGAAPAVVRDTDFWVLGRGVWLLVGDDRVACTGKGLNLATCRLRADGPASVWIVLDRGVRLCG